LASGCAQEALPETYVVQGKVVGKDGRPFAGGAITFRPVANQEFQAYGEIAEDGAFTLHTLGHTSDGRARNLQGTIEGEFKVQIEPSDGRPFWLSKTYRIDPKDKNEITVVVEK
jgi:hypothetical protein